MSEPSSNDLDGFVDDLATVLTQAWLAAKPEIDAARSAGGHAAAAAVVRRVLAWTIEDIFDEALEE